MRLLKKRSWGSFVLPSYALKNQANLEKALSLTEQEAVFQNRLTQ